MAERLKDEPANDALVREVARANVPIFHRQLAELLKEDYADLMGRSFIKEKTQQTLADVIEQTVTEYLVDRLRLRTIYKDRLN